MALIHYEKGDIFESQAQVIVNTVNCKGVMGKGLALAFKQRYPDIFPVYQQECKTGKLRIGRPTLYKESTPWILSFPTKNHWKFPSKMEYIEKGLAYFVAHYKEAGITSIAFPKLGAQNGKLSWDDVGPVMAKYLGPLDIDVYIYIADGDQEYQSSGQQVSEAKVDAWKLFNEVALSKERLEQEVQLKRDAKKIAQKRELLEFTSLADFETIENLAKVSLKRIKSYINHQQCESVELTGMSSNIVKPVRDNGKKKKAASLQKKSRGGKSQAESNEIPMEPLFPLEEHIS